jgi:hypothetical protein
MDQAGYGLEQEAFADARGGLTDGDLVRRVIAECRVANGARGLAGRFLAQLHNITQVFACQGDPRMDVRDALATNSTGVPLEIRRENLP